MRVDGDAHRKTINKRTVTVWPTNKQLQDPRPKSFEISCCRDPALKALRHWDHWASTTPALLRLPLLLPALLPAAVTAPVALAFPSPAVAAAAAASPLPSPSYAARTRAQNAPSARARKPECASSAAVRRAAACATSVRAARAKPGVWFFASSWVGMAA